MKKLLVLLLIVLFINSEYIVNTQYLYSADKKKETINKTDKKTDNEVNTNKIQNDNPKSETGTITENESDKKVTEKTDEGTKEPNQKAKTTNIPFDENANGSFMNFCFYLGIIDSFGLYYLLSSDTKSWGLETIFVGLLGGGAGLGLGYLAISDNDISEGQELVIEMAFEWGLVMGFFMPVFFVDHLDTITGGQDSANKELENVSTYILFSLLTNLSAGIGTYFAVRDIYISPAEGRVISYFNTWGAILGIEFSFIFSNDLLSLPYELIAGFLIGGSSSIVAGAILFPYLDYNRIELQTMHTGMWLGTLAGVGLATYYSVSKYKDYKDANNLSTMEKVDKISPSKIGLIMFGSTLLGFMTSAIIVSAFGTEKPLDNSDNNNDLDIVYSNKNIDIKLPQISLQLNRNPLNKLDLEPVLTLELIKANF